MDQPTLYMGSPAAQTLSIKAPEPNNLIIHGGASGEALVTISFKDGSMTFGRNYAPDVAAQTFWSAVSSEYRTFLKWKAEHPDAR